MTDLINKKAAVYAAGFSSEEDEILNCVANYTNLYHPYAHMISGHVQGKFLETISCLMKPEKILEIGTFTGYSALCLVKGLEPNGKLHTIELREDDAVTAQRFFSKSLHNNKIVLHQGNAINIIPTLNEEWDIIFIDADKTGYIDYYELTLPQLKKNGLMIADNVLFHGEVLAEIINGKNAKAIHAFNKHVAEDKRVEQVMITLRDGLLLIRKL
jgi:predicted O-methyltransferase YrrM